VARAVRRVIRMRFTPRRETATPAPAARGLRECRTSGRLYRRCSGTASRKDEKCPPGGQRRLLGAMVVGVAAHDEPDGMHGDVARVEEPVRGRRVEGDGVPGLELVLLEPDLDSQGAGH